MRAILSNNLFRGSSSATDLLSLFVMGWRDRHRIHLEERENPTYLDWLQQRGKEEQLECALALEEGFRQDGEILLGLKFIFQNALTRTGSPILRN